MEAFCREEAYPPPSTTYSASRNDDRDHEIHHERSRESLALPAVPTHPLPPHTKTPISLPDIRSLHLPTSKPAPPSTFAGLVSLPPPKPWGFSSHHHHTPSCDGLSLPPLSPMDTTMSDAGDSARGTLRNGSVVSLDVKQDEETRAAAEALSGLRNSEYRPHPSANSNIPPNTANSVNMSARPIHSPLSSTPIASPPSQIQRAFPPIEEEPLLSLITSHHPWIGGTLSGSLYAYNSTLHYTPAFVSTISNVFASGIETVSRRTGVESRVRQYFGDSRSQRAGQKRTRDPSPGDAEMGLSPVHSRQRSRTSSSASFDGVESLPAYDEDSAPAYEKQSLDLASNASKPWPTRVVITTSGLGVALSDKSLKSLRFCLGILKNATDHLTHIMTAIKLLIVEYESTVLAKESNGEAASPGQPPQYTRLSPEQEAASREIAERIKAHGCEIWTTLQNVTTSVSKYTGGALPENAGALVRRQLLSMPHRWNVAGKATDGTTSGGENESGRGASAGVEDQSGDLKLGQRLLAFAAQGVDMISQVSMVLSGTVDSAEKWLKSMGRKPSDGCGVEAWRDYRGASPKTAAWTGTASMNGYVYPNEGVPEPMKGVEMTERPKESGKDVEQALL